INESPVIADIVNSMAFGIPDPLLFDPEIGPASDLAFDPIDFFWTDHTNPSLTNILDNEDRHDFSLNTCSGCHGGETETFFTHVTWTTPGVEAPLSGFIEGMTMNDPMDSGTVREFDEKDRRRQDLQNLIDNSCFGGFMLVPAAFVH
ncbi:MAG: hypothetical protein AAGG01_03885, partial [Planctomycetota bacterium]